MSALSGLLGMVAILLAVGGLSKGRQPAPTVRSLRALGLPARPAVVRTLAVVEVGLGGLLVLVGGRWASGAAAVLFLAFTWISVRLLRSGPAGASCGCFGDRSAPPSAIHVAVDAGAAIVAIVAAVAATAGPIAGRSHHLGQDLTGLALVGLGGYLLVALMSVLPDALAAAGDADEPVARTFGLQAPRP